MTIVNKKIIVILGSEGRIGSSLINHLSNKNNFIIAADINKKKNFGKDVFQLKIDLSKEKNLKKLIVLINKKFKKIDCIVNCIYPRISTWGKSFEIIKKDELNKHFSSHLTDLIITSRVFIKYFINQKKGNLIFLSSIQGLGAPKFDHYLNTKMSSCLEYSVIKAGIINMTKYLAKYFKGKNIRFNCISIGGIKADQPKIFKENYKKSCLNKGLLDPADILSAFDFLISDKSSYVNGQNIIIDDGWSL